MCKRFNKETIGDSVRICIMEDDINTTPDWYVNQSLFSIAHRSLCEIFMGFAISMYDSELQAEMRVDELDWQKADIDLYSPKFNVAIDVRGGWHYSNEKNVGENGRDAKKEHYFIQRGSRVLVINETSTLKQFNQADGIVENGGIEELVIWRNVNSKAHLCKGNTNKSLIIATNRMLREVTGDQEIDITAQADMLFELAIKLKFGVEAWNCM